MNPPEVAALLVRFQDTYPQAPPFRRGTVNEWASSPVADLDADDAFATFDEWRIDNDWPPTIRQFLIAADTRRRALAALVADAAGLPTETIEVAPADPATALAFIALCQDTAAKAPGRAYSHDHHQGAARCPVCSRVRQERMTP